MKYILTLLLIISIKVEGQYWADLPARKTTDYRNFTEYKSADTIPTYCCTNPYCLINHIGVNVCATRNLPVIENPILLPGLKYYDPKDLIIDSLTKKLQLLTEHEMYVCDILQYLQLKGRYKRDQYVRITNRRPAADAVRRYQNRYATN